MALTGWKAFRFFDQTEVQLPSEERALLAERLNITCVASGSDNVFFGSYHGFVHVLSKSFKTALKFRAHDSGAITHMKQVHGTSLLVTIAEDSSSDPVLNVWALDKKEKKTGSPACQCTLTIQHSRKHPRVSTITAFAALDNLSQLAIGFDDGSVTVVRGDLIHDRGAKQRTVFDGEEPVTGIEFCESNTTLLYIATTAKISTLVISGRGQGQPAHTFEGTGCAVHCLTKDSSTNDVVVGREDGVYYYGPRGKGPVYAFEGPKQSVSIFKDYVVITSPPQIKPARHGSGAMINDFDNSTFTVLNTDFKLIAHQENINSQIRFVIKEWGDLFLITFEGKILRYREKPFKQQLDLLLQKDLYVFAIDLARKFDADVAQQNLIYRKYGDYLYEKGDYDMAMQQYLEAIDNTEPSQVIRKFLDTHRIENLIAYLTLLHQKHRVTPDHTTLLLNCYAKLKDVKKLEEFIKSPDDLKFNVDTVITMCRQGGFFNQAAYLARKHEEHDLVVDVLVEDCKKYAEAMAYIWRLHPQPAYTNLMKYATVLLQNCSADATKLFIDYYTGSFKPKKDAVIGAAAPNNDNAQIGFGGRAATAVQNLAALIPLPYMSISASDTSGTNPEIIETTTTEPPFKYDIQKPRIAFSAFVDHPKELIEFLEACTTKKDWKKEDETDIYVTLFEMYLQTANSSQKDRKFYQDKAKALIETKTVLFESSNVLLLSHLSDFDEGTILVKEKQGLRFDIFRSYTTAKDTTGAIKALHKYGDEEPELYPAALAYFTSSPEVLKEAGEELGLALEKIDQDGLMAPLQVVQTLSATDVTTMGMLKPYLSRVIHRESQEISNNGKLISTYRTQTNDKLLVLNELQTKPTTFNVSSCSSCLKGLDLPTIHFLCKHSFHQRCLNHSSTLSTDPSSTSAFLVTAESSLTDQNSTELPHFNDEAPAVECPLCAKENETVKQIRKAQKESVNKHDLFLQGLKRSHERFSMIAQWFGRGVMNDFHQ